MPTVGDEIGFESLLSRIFLYDKLKPGQLHHRLISGTFERFPVGRPVVFWRWDEGSKSTLLIVTCQPVPQPPGLVAGPAAPTIRFALYECPQAMVPDFAMNAKALPVEAAASLAAKATLVAGGAFACGPSKHLIDLGSGVQVYYDGLFKNRVPDTMCTLGNEFRWWIADDEARGKPTMNIRFYNHRHASPKIDGDGILSNPEGLVSLQAWGEGLPASDTFVKVLQCQENRTINKNGSLEYVTTEEPNWFLVLRRESP